MIKTPGSVNAQQGSGGPSRVSRGVRAGGSNQGKVSTSGNRRYTGRRKQGQ